jgi:hypothetical protein
MRYAIALLCCLAASCASYGNGHEPEACSTMAHCNPGKDCGDLVQCIDGECDPEQTKNLPCEQPCQSNQDCTVDMHCRDGVCVADGTCVDVSECLHLPCPDIDCVGGYTCQDGICVFECMSEDDRYSCKLDSDCTRVQAFCCECQYGVPEIGINRDFEDEYMSELMEFCARADYHCPGYNACTDHQAVCHQGRCTMIYERCGCEETWDPVCMGSQAAGVWVTVRNECVADCQGIEWDYHGRCDCAVECFIADPVCAENGVTYWCGEPEANCNGHAVDYAGECQ